jgi:REP element-mobilizing transposase RayT
MPRANRHFLPGRIWHITHRCHKKEFLLKFRLDKRLWIHWALQAKIRFGLAVLNFMITSNHVHVLATILRGRGRPDALPRAIQLIESRVAQAFNARKERHGAFWEDRYHATAVEDGVQLARCLTYIDMNMVRAGVVRHPADWLFCGYHELGHEAASPPIQRRRGFLVDTDALLELTGSPDIATHLARRTEWIDAAIRKGRLEREPLWTESIAVGSEPFLRSFRDELGTRIGTAEIVRAGAEDDDATVLRRTRGNPIIVFGGKNAGLKPGTTQNQGLSY